MSYNTSVAALDKGLEEDCGAEIINLALEECLLSLVVQKMLGSVLFTSSTSKLIIEKCSVIRKNLLLVLFT